MTAAVDGCRSHRWRTTEASGAIGNAGDMGCNIADIAMAETAPSTSSSALRRMPATASPHVCFVRSSSVVPNWTAASVCEAVLAEVNGAGRIHTCSSSLQGSLCHQGSFCTRFKLFPTEFLTRQSDAQPPSGRAFCTLTAAPPPCTAPSSVKTGCCHG